MADLTTTTHATFIPEQWADEVQVSYEGKIVVVNKVKKETFGTGNRKGDILHYPLVTSLTTSDIVDNADIEGEAPTESEVTVTLNKKKHASIYIPKHLGANFSKYDIRSQYTGKVGAALAKQLDLDLLVTLETLSASVGEVDASATDITDQMIRDAMEVLDEADVPEESRGFILYPDQRSAMLGIAKFVEAQTMGASGGSNSIVNGRVLDVYGNTVDFTTNITQAGSNPNEYRKGIFLHSDAAVLALPKMGPDISYDWIPRRKAFLLSGDMLYGSALYRSGNGLVVNTDN